MGLFETISAAVQKDMPSVYLTDTLRTAITKLSKSSEAAMTVKSGDELVGIITDMDLLDCLVRGVDLDSNTVSSCMTACELISARGAKTPCVQLDEGESIKNALDVMHEAGVHNLLVSGGGEGAIGMVSLKNLLKFVVS